MRECGRALHACSAISIRLCRASETARRAGDARPNRALPAYRPTGRARGFRASRRSAWLMARETSLRSLGCRDDEVPAEVMGQPLEDIFGERAACAPKLGARQLIDADLKIIECSE